MEKINFSKTELERYSRHLIIPEFNIEGQRKLKCAKVLVVGCGGLGSPLLLYLAAAGVGNIGIIDFDVVDDSNLQRQILFDVENVGQPKVEVAKNRILALNPHINVVTYNTKLTSKNAFDIIKRYDLVADGTDNFPTRYLVNDACVLLGKPNVYASIYRFEGQVSVFNYLNKDGNIGPNYRDIFPSPPPLGLVPSCAEGGVLGVLPGIIGSLQANEVIKVITNIGEPLNGRLFLFDALSFETRILKIRRDEKNPLNGKEPTQADLIDYLQFCGVGTEEDSNNNINLKEISVQELDLILKNENKQIQLIDVREQYETEIATLGGELIPLKAIAKYVNRIDKNKNVVLYCRSGKRSAEAIEILEEKFGFKNLYNLRGGILAFAKEIDNSLAIY